jgi:hypothetical protein
MLWAKTHPWLHLLFTSFLLMIGAHTSMQECLAHLIGAHILTQESLLESSYSPNLLFKQGELTKNSISIEPIQSIPAITRTTWVKLPILNLITYSVALLWSQHLWNLETKTIMIPKLTEYNRFIHYLLLRDEEFQTWYSPRFPQDLGPLC